jgi:ABC-2 type transport system permease protein
MFIMLLTNSTVAIIAEDRGQRTLTRLFAAPVRNLEIILGYFMGSFGVGTFQISVIVLFTRYGLGYHFGLSLLHLTLIPSCMIGGCFWPIGLKPDALQKLANFVPQKWVIDAIMKLASGHLFIDIRLNLGILALFALVLITFGYGLLKPAEKNII